MPFKSGGEFVCPFCKKGFHNRGNMRRHVVTHHNRTLPGCKVKCPRCTAKFETVHAMRVHANAKHEVSAQELVGDPPLCACGCGERVAFDRYRGGYSKWRRGHQRRKHSDPAAFSQRDAKINERLLRIYGITRAEYEDLLARQGSCCAICMASAPGKRRVLWCVDHCHKTGRVRGLLCAMCNSSLGGFKDSPHILRWAISYLEGSQP